MSETCVSWGFVLSVVSGGPLEKRDTGRACHTRFYSDPQPFTAGKRAHSLIFYIFWIKVDLLSLSLLNLSAAASRGGADLRFGCYNVISLSSSILTADCRGNVQRRVGKTAGKQTEPESLS